MNHTSPDPTPRSVSAALMVEGTSADSVMTSSQELVIVVAPQPPIAGPRPSTTNIEATENRLLRSRERTLTEYQYKR